MNNIIGKIILVHSFNKIVFSNTTLLKMKPVLVMNNKYTKNTKPNIMKPLYPKNYKVEKLDMEQVLIEVKILWLQHLLMKMLIVCLS